MLPVRDWADSRTRAYLGGFGIVVLFRCSFLCTGASLYGETVSAVG